MLQRSLSLAVLAITLVAAVGPVRLRAEGAPGLRKDDLIGLIREFRKADADSNGALSHPELSARFAWPAPAVATGSADKEHADPAHGLQKRDLFHLIKDFPRIDGDRDGALSHQEMVVYFHHPGGDPKRSEAEACKGEGRCKKDPTRDCCDACKKSGGSSCECKQEKPKAADEDECAGSGSSKSCPKTESPRPACSSPVDTTDATDDGPGPLYTDPKLERVMARAKNWVRSTIAAVKRREGPRWNEGSEGPRRKWRRGAPHRRGGPGHPCCLHSGRGELDGAGWRPGKFGKHRSHAKNRRFFARQDGPWAGAGHRPHGKAHRLDRHREGPPPGAWRRHPGKRGWGRGPGAEGWRHRADDGRGHGRRRHRRVEQRIIETCEGECSDRDGCREDRGACEKRRSARAACKRTRTVAEATVVCAR